jgi:hypothetical protein
MLQANYGQMQLWSQSGNSYKNRRMTSFSDSGPYHIRSISGRSFSCAVEHKAGVYNLLHVIRTEVWSANTIRSDLLRQIHVQYKHETRLTSLSLNQSSEIHCQLFLFHSNVRKKFPRQIIEGKSRSHSDTEGKCVLSEQEQIKRNHRCRPILTNR